MKCGIEADSLRCSGHLLPGCFQHGERGGHVQRRKRRRTSQLLDERVRDERVIAHREPAMDETMTYGMRCTWHVARDVFEGCRVTFKAELLPGSLIVLCQPKRSARAADFLRLSLPQKPSRASGGRVESELQRRRAAVERENGQRLHFQFCTSGRSSPC